MSPLPPEDLRALAARLRDIRSRALAEVQDDLAVQAQVQAQADGRPQDRADGAETRRQEEIGWAEMEIDRHTAAEADLALRLIGAGSYGTCVDCGEPIPRARLFARPTAIRCAGCQAARETTRHP